MIKIEDINDIMMNFFLTDELLSQNWQVNYMKTLQFHDNGYHKVFQIFLTNFYWVPTKFRHHVVCYRHIREKHRQNTDFPRTYIMVK